MQRGLITVCVVACMTFFGCASDGGKPDPKAERPADTSTATETQLTSEIPLSSSEETNIRHQVEQNWNVAAGPDECPLEQRKPIELRVRLDPDGKVTKIEPAPDMAQDKCSLMAYDSARRAVMISSPLKLPPGKSFPTIVLRFNPAEVAQ